jgi:ankyrin repeat protein
MEDQMSNDVDRLIGLIEQGQAEAALAILNQNPGLATGSSERDGVLRGATPLHWAAHRDMVRLCERLIELGADVNSSMAMWWRTPLAWAADAGAAGAVELLLHCGADVNQDAFGQTTALHAAAQGGSSGGSQNAEGYRRTAALLIAHGADINRRAVGDSNQTPLDDAIRRDNQAVASVLLQHGARSSEAL